MRDSVQSRSHSNEWLIDCGVESESASDSAYSAQRGVAVSRSPRTVVSASMHNVALVNGLRDAGTLESMLSSTSGLRECDRAPIE